MSKDVQEIFPLAARTATSSRTFSTDACQGLFYINVTAASATPSVVFTIAGMVPDNSATASYTILDSAAITGTGLTVLRVSPQLTAAPNTIAKDMLPATLKITATHADADSITYSFSFVGLE